MRAYRNGVFSMTKMRPCRRQAAHPASPRNGGSSRMVFSMLPKRWLKLMLRSTAMIRSRSQAEVSRTIPVEPPFRIVAHLMRLDFLLAKDLAHCALHRAGEAFVPRRRSVLARMAGQKPRRAQSSLALYELRKLRCDVAPGEPAGACGGLCLRSNVAGSARQRLSVRHVDRRHSWPRGIWLKPSDLGTIYYGNAESLLPWLGSKAHERT